MSFCVNCGSELAKGAKFCQGCGARVGQAAGDATETSEKRQQAYVGKVYKCPNCGEVVDAIAAICPTCKYRLSDREASRTLQELKDALVELDGKQKSDGVGKSMVKAYLTLCGIEPKDPIVTQKVTLIKNFPVPNDVGEILELVILASSNIDVEKSKRGLSGVRIPFMPVNHSMAEKKISDAWLTKMEQSYKRAEILFVEDPLFAKIKKIYDDKMKELGRA